ncbi:hypothetical protein [Bacillus sp. FJAT-45350]|uniref:hypothetical protein n=1 Tax=Bacillus sp. FJAT-45350 TaxID=2011014 RepID=UPI000BB7C791|nr:hypothetical protein [Bacillus sp. FJAT-45350]
MKRFWLVSEDNQYAVYDSKEKTITDWVDIELKENVSDTILNLRNTLERHDEEIGDIEDINGKPIIEVIGHSD